jgi:hypothetical protein
VRMAFASPKLGEDADEAIPGERQAAGNHEIGPLPPP